MEYIGKREMTADEIRQMEQSERDRARETEKKPPASDYIIKGLEHHCKMYEEEIKGLKDEISALKLVIQAITRYFN